MDKNDKKALSYDISRTVWWQTLLRASITSLGMNPINNALQDARALNKALRQIHCELRDINLRLDYLIDQFRGKI